MNPGLVSSVGICLDCGASLPNHLPDCQSPDGCQTIFTGEREAKVAKTITEHDAVAFLDAVLPSMVEQSILVERLAALAHEQWSGWMRYLFSQGEENPDGSFTIPRDKVGRWQRQLRTDYAQLPENERESDRVEARKVLDLLAFDPSDTVPLCIHQGIDDGPLPHKRPWLHCYSAEKGTCWKGPQSEAKQAERPFEHVCPKCGKTNQFDFIDAPQEEPYEFRKRPRASQ